MFGQPLVSEGGLGPDIIAPIYTTTDRADPTITEEALPKLLPETVAPRPAIAPPVLDAQRNAASASPIVAQSIRVSGTELPPETFADVIVHYVGRELDQSELGRLAGDIAGAARKNGYPMATAAIPVQDLAAGRLNVDLDYGRIDAVRVVGATNPHADRLLSQALVTGRPVRQADLERALLLIGDMPGMRVKESRLIRQQGFGILLVTVTQDRALAYAQIDNRGTEEVGSLRSTILGIVRGVAIGGDEFALLLSNTPTNPSEFAFVRGRYSLPVGAAGDALTVSASYGRSNPGGALRSLDVIGHSVDAGLGYARPLFRSRKTSLLGSIEYRHLEIDQSLLGTRLRNDRLDTLTGTLDGAFKLGGGNLRGQLSATWGLPLAGVSHEGDRLISRRDGDARFALASYSAEWVRPLSEQLSVVLASAGQLASRPLLATAEIGVGGPTFGRAYDYSERTGDNGVLGSFEIRADVPPLSKSIFDRPQFLAFVDGGTVWNLRRGYGGGTVLSAGLGARLGIGGFDLGLEVAKPLNTDRFDTGNRSPRLSFRVARML